MRRLAWIISLLAITASSFAYDVEIYGTDIGGGKLEIGYHATSENNIPAAFAIDVVLSGGECSGTTYLSNSYNVYIDAANDIVTGGGEYYIGDGWPFADIDAAGSVSFPTDNFCLSMAYLPDESNMPPGLDGVLVVLQLTSNSGWVDVTLSPNAVRGGVVRADAEDPNMDAVFPDTFAVQVPEPATIGLLAIGFAGLLRKK